jgi:hypothetical protein
MFPAQKERLSDSRLFEKMSSLFLLTRANVFLDIEFLKNRDLSE